MSLAFWRRSQPPPEFNYTAWTADRLRVARAFAVELRGWSEPIDTIRAALELPERWQRSSQRAWAGILTLAGSLYEPPSYLATHPGAVYGTHSAPRSPYPDPERAYTGNPIHDEALRAALGLRKKGRWIA